MARALRVFAASSLLLVPLAACSLLVDTSGLGGNDGDASGDGSTTAADAAQDSPGSTDGAAATDGPVGEAGDAGADVVDSSVKTCTPSATRLCDDFDDSMPGTRWTSKDTNRGTITFDAVGLSLPHAFEAKIVGGSGSASANLIETYPSVRANIRCELDLKLSDVPATGEIDVIDFITTVPGAQSYHVYFASFSSTWAVAEFQGRPDAGDLDRITNLGAALPKDSWFHVVLEQASATATLTANGTVATLASLTMPAGTDTSVTIGVTYTSASVQSADVLIDNVDCSVLP